MESVKIGDTVRLQFPDNPSSPANGTVHVVTDVIRCVFSRKPIALEITFKSGNTSTLPIDYFYLA